MRPGRWKVQARTLEMLWYIAAFAYAILRIVLAALFAAPYGLPIVGFAIVELLGTGVDSFGVIRVVRSMRAHDADAATRWGVVWAAGFFAPDIYVLVTTRHAPWWLICVVLFWASVSSVLAVRSLLRKVAEERAAVADELAQPAARHSGG